MGAVRKETKETKMVHKVRRQDGRSVILRGHAANVKEIIWNRCQA